MSTDNPSVTRTNHILPFGELSPVQFERLCLWLVEYEGYKRAEHLGEAGSEQGRDVIAFLPAETGEQLWYFQCKRYQTINAAMLIKEVEKYNNAIAAGAITAPHGVVFVTNAVVSAAARKKVAAFCKQHGYACEWWARTELDTKVKKYADVMKEFFQTTSAQTSTQVDSQGNRNITIIGNVYGSLTTGDTASQPQPLSLQLQQIAIARLPVTGPDLFGREAELKLLDDAWADPNTNVVVFVAWGGVGKSALVNTWLARLARDQYRGAERVYAWSFYSQGTSDERAASADLFIESALRWFGDQDPTAGSPWDKGERLANLIRRTRTLLVLDGLEPLQHPPGRANWAGQQEGKLKDQAMQALLRELAAQQHGLCVVSTRLKISDLEGFERSTVAQQDLDHLAPQAGAQILRAQGVVGDAAELEAASAEFGGHSLALTLLGSYLADVCGGDIRRRGEIGNLEEDERHGGHARRVMAAYEKWLGEGPELAVLRLLGLFDRPAPADAIAVLRAAPVIPGLTEYVCTGQYGERERPEPPASSALPSGGSLTLPVPYLSETKWQQTLSKLRRIKLLAEPSRSSQRARGTADELDAHPLVREHFGEQMRQRLPDAWREAHNRLYEHLTHITPNWPDTLAGLTPLYAAVAHGCAAGRQQEVYDEVYRQRILRGDEFYSTMKLGAFGADLAALSGFFTTPWRQPVDGLREADKAFVLNQAGFRLRALGRLVEAAQPMQMALEICIALNDWKNAAFAAGSLSDIWLTLGDLPSALSYAKRSVELRNRGKDIFKGASKLTILGYVLHQAGRLSEAASAFREAEALQQQSRPEQPYLYSLPGYRYCDLLLGQGKVQAVLERAAKAIEWEKGRLLDIALDNLALGRAYLSLTDADARAAAAHHLHRAVDGLRQAGQLQYLPIGLLARAALYRLTGEHDLAQRDLAEAHRIAERGEMGLHLCDCHLEWARLHLAQGEPTRAREHWATAQAMIERMGYHRRDGEVAEIEAQLNVE